MKRLLIVLIILTVAVAIGLSLHRHPGVVVVTFAGWRVDMPLWLAIVGIIVTYYTFYYLSALISAIVEAFTSLGGLFERYRLKRAKANTEQGYKALVLGEYEKARKLLVKGAEHSELPWLNYLSAAKAAQAEGKLAERDSLLARAAQISPQNDLAIQMTACEFAYEQGDWDKSLTLLQSLSKELPKHPHVTALLKDIYWKQKNWAALLDLLPKIKSAHLLSTPAYEAFEKRVWQEVFLQMQELDVAQVPTLWQRLPRSFQSDPVFIHVYAQALMKLREGQDAEKLLRKAIEKQWNEDLVRLYGKVELRDPNKQLSLAEKWLKNHMESPGLLAALGDISERLGFDEKAQWYYEASLSLAPSVQTLTALGTHWEKLNRPELGGEYFKKAFALLSSNPS